jgi:hypothetical protein
MLVRSRSELGQDIKRLSNSFISVVVWIVFLMKKKAAGLPKLLFKD